MILSEEAKRLLDEKGLFVVPCEINHDAFKMVVYVCALYADKALTFHCAGEGGDTAAALGIVSVIRQHGRVTGLLASEANSCSGIIFASCAERYVYPHGSIGVHGVTLGELSRIDAAYAQTWLTEVQTTNKHIAGVLADACKHPFYNAEFWLTEINEQGGSGYKRFHSYDLINCGMAKPIESMPKWMQSVPKPAAPIEESQPNRAFYKTVEGSERAV